MDMQGKKNIKHAGQNGHAGEQFFGKSIIGKEKLMTKNVARVEDYEVFFLKRIFPLLIYFVLHLYSVH